MVAVNDGVDQGDRPQQERSAATSCSRTSTATATRTRTSARSRALPGPKSDAAADRTRPPARSSANARRRHARADAPPRPAASSTRRTRSPSATAARDVRDSGCPGRRRRSRSACSRTRLPGRARRRRPRAAARRPDPQERQLRDLQELLLAALRPRPEQGRACAAQEGLARDRRHDRRPHRPDRRPAQRAHLDFAIRPAGRGAPRIDPKPILDGWKLLEATAIYRASGKNVALRRRRRRRMSIGQILLLPKPLLEQRVLADERIEIYECGRDDIRSGQIDRRVLATLAYLAESGPAARASPRSSAATASTPPRATSPHHSSGNAVDIATVNGIPILGHQEPGRHHRADRAAAHAAPGHDGARTRSSRCSRSAAPTFAMADHDDHIHVGFQPMFGANRKLGKQALAVLKPGQWSDLIVAPARDRQPGRADQAVEVRAARQGQAREPGPPGRVGPRPRPATAKALRLRPAGVRLPARAARRPLPGAARRRRRPSRRCWC